MHFQRPVAPCQRGCATEEGHSRTATGIPGDFEVVPAHRRRTGEGLKRLEGRLLGGDPGSEMRSGPSHALHVGDLGIGQQLFHGPRPMAREQPVDPWDVHEIDPDSDDAARGDAQKISHHQVTSGRSQSGAARNPPITRPR